MPETSFRLRLPLLIAGALLLFLGSLSVIHAPTPGLDPSWQQVLGYAREQRFILGKDILFTYGPWGWLSTAYCQPSEYWPRFAWELLIKGALAAGWFAVATRVTWWRSLALLAFGLLLLPFFTDTTYVLLIVGPLIWLVATGEKRPWVGAVIGAVLGFLAMQKFTFFVMAGAGSAGVSLCLWFRKDRPLALTLSGAWIAGMLVSWCAAQQALADLPGFVRQSLAISSAYQDAMSFREKLWVFYCGLAGVIFTSLTILVFSWRNRGPLLTRAALAATCAGFGYLTWKHGFVRADGHVLGFFFATTVVALIAPRAWVLTLPLLGVSLAGAYLAAPDLVIDSPLHARNHLRDGIRAVLHPVAQHERFLAQTEKARVANDMPVTRSLIGNASVDVFGFEQSAALINQFNYRPRPAFQGYGVWTPALSDINAAHYTGPHAPEFVLTRIESIDGRLPTLDDTRVVFLLRKHYVPVGEEKEFLILKRATQPMPFAAPETPLLQGKLGQATDFGPNDLSGPVWARINVRPSLLGRLRAIFYKPAEIQIRVELADGTSTVFRYIPTLGSGGFLLSPHLPDTAAYKAWFAHSPTPDVRRITIFPRKKDLRFFQPDFSYQLGPLPPP